MKSLFASLAVVAALAVTSVFIPNHDSPPNSVTMTAEVVHADATPGAVADATPGIYNDFIRVEHAAIVDSADVGKADLKPGAVILLIDAKGNHYSMTVDNVQNQPEPLGKQPAVDTAI